MSDATSKRAAKLAAACAYSSHADTVIRAIERALRAERNAALEEAANECDTMYAKTLEQAVMLEAAQVRILALKRPAPRRGRGKGKR